MDFIFMLTRHDRTVEDCLAVLDRVVPLGLAHIGFKDVGVALPVLRTLNRRIKEAGATSYMEVVSETPQAALDSARAAVDIGVDVLLGGTDIDAIQAILAGTAIACYPFPGRPVGHPTRLDGTPEQIADHCRAFVDKGAAGVDLLAYRATAAEPLALVRAARAALGGRGRLIVAGSIDSPARVRALAGAGADAFTIGSAIFDGTFAPGVADLAARVRAVLDACRDTRAAAP
ncbi:MAG: hypothetical protein D6826_01455 [Alphaproteobacteria bacterium]|nr:MAG: hypothetical protein D6826_01455 [Alphaproteobacteria bacterium]